MTEYNRKNLITVAMLVIMIALFFPENMVSRDAVEVYSESGENITDCYDEEELYQLLCNAEKGEIKVRSRLIRCFLQWMEENHEERGLGVDQGTPQNTGR